MFSPVYEDVSGLFGRPVPVTGYAPSGELHFPQAHFRSDGDAQTPPQQQCQQQQAPQQMRPTFSLVDANGNLIPQQTLSPPQQQHSMASSVNAISFNTLNGSSIIPLEIYLQQQQQRGQVRALPSKTPTFQTPDGVKYFLSASPTGTPILSTGQAPPQGVLCQQGGQAVYAIEHSGSASSFFSASLNAPGGNTSSLQNSSGDFSFFVANGLPTATTTTTTNNRTATPVSLSMNPNTGAMAAVQGSGGIVNTSPDQRSRTLVNNTLAMNIPANVNRSAMVVETIANKTTVEVFDPDFKFMYDMPASAVVHLPPARLNITRLVLCRNYRPYNPQSCAMSGNCKFVHADCDYTKLEAHPIHVNYIWRHESLCTYPRLPAGEKRKIVQVDGKVVEVRSERILVTRGAQASSRDRNGAPLSSCDCYESNGMCYQGERCSCIHVVVVDPFVQGDFKRAPRKRDMPTASSGHAFSSIVVQRSTSTTSNDHSQTQSQVFQQQQQQQLQPRQQFLLQQHCHSGSSDTETSNSSATVRPAVRSGAVSTTATSVAASPESILSPATLARLQDAMAMQLHTPAAASPHQIVPSFNISLTPFAVQTLTNTASAGTLLYLPRGGMEAVVIGPVGAAEGVKMNDQTPRSQK